MTENHLIERLSRLVDISLESLKLAYDELTYIDPERAAEIDALIESGKFSFTIETVDELPPIQGIDYIREYIEKIIEQIDGFADELRNMKNVKIK
ncbi:MAG: hypothetical protein NWE89_12625 [Candidatus Bathyarchaeota archaeon]|nr:hypothetical protein [Candidatus Bathyarchaeota archaeon]